LWKNALTLSRRRSSLAAPRYVQAAAFCRYLPSIDHAIRRVNCQPAENSLSSR